MNHWLYKYDVNKEYVRFQPFHLSHQKEKDRKLTGCGMITGEVIFISQLTSLPEIP